MKLKLYSLLDRKTMQFANPMFLVAHGQATRALQDEVNREAADNPLWKHTDDFAMYYLGEWDNDHCKWELLDAPEFLIEAQTLKQH